MIIPDKKKTAGIIVAMHLGKKPDEPKEEESEAEYGDDEEYKIAAEEVISAVKAGDAGKLADALVAFHHLCDAAQYREEAEESEETAEEKMHE